MARSASRKSPVTSKAQDAAQKLAWAVGRNGLLQSPTPVLADAAAALAGHPDTVSRERILAEIARRAAARAQLLAAIGA